MSTMSVVLSDLSMVSYTAAAFLALLVYDTLLQINEEYVHVWKSKWSLIKVLYIWTRTFISSIVTLVQVRFHIGVTELILMVRTYTLYERSKKLLAFFFVLWFSMAGVSFWAVTKWTTSSRFTSSTPEMPSCYFSNSGGIGIGLLFRRFSNHKSALFESLYRDGVWFYLGILPFTIGAVALLFFAPVGLASLADSPVSVMHSVLCCRLITHARVVAAEEDKRAFTSSRVSKTRHRVCPDVVIDITPASKV
ncbi:hypothetical protein C8R43DRAFT_367952 [Mycena crocata]|nr:hypothetical protein C8R43DRAFT_367952 [Mycena crocata]